MMVFTVKNGYFQWMTDKKEIKYGPTFDNEFKHGHKWHLTMIYWEQKVNQVPV